jgi:predicted NAD-dependent protein-ADP-ribosyltransferase YbiA (DUF1768 family)
MGFNEVDNFFLNNKYSCSVFILSRRFGNAEAAYQAHKTKEPQIRDIFTTIDAVNSQSLGRRVNAYDGWEDDKINAMLLVVFEKFRQNPDILEKLLQTGNQKIVAISLSKETFWGTDDGVGEKILMYIRTYFKTRSVKNRENLYSNWEDLHHELHFLSIAIKNYGTLYSKQDLDKYNLTFSDCIERINTLKMDTENYISFFRVDRDILTQATKEFVE